MIGYVVIALLVVSFGFVVLRGAPYVPTHRKQLRAAFRELYSLTERDTVVDLGSGDGIVLLEAAERGAGGIGYELNPFLVAISSWRARRHKHVRFLLQDYSLLPKLPEQTTVVYAFTTGHSIERIGQLMEGWSERQELYFISYGFQLQSKKPVRTHGPMTLYHFKPKA